MLTTLLWFIYRDTDNIFSSGKLLCPAWRRGVQRVGWGGLDGISWQLAGGAARFWSLCWLVKMAEAQWSALSPHSERGAEFGSWTLSSLLFMLVFLSGRKSYRRKVKVLLSDLWWVQITSDKAMGCNLFSTEAGSRKPETDTRLHMLLHEGRKVPTDQSGAGFNIQHSIGDNEADLVWPFGNIGAFCANIKWEIQLVLKGNLDGSKLQVSETVLMK